MVPMSKNVPLTQDQLTNLMVLLDLAVKQGGLQVAGAAAEIGTIVNAVIQQEAPKSETKEK